MAATITYGQLREHVYSSGGHYLRTVDDGEARLLRMVQAAFDQLVISGFGIAESARRSVVAYSSVEDGWVVPAGKLGGIRQVGYYSDSRTVQHIAEMAPHQFYLTNTMSTFTNVSYPLAFYETSSTTSGVVSVVKILPEECSYEGNLAILHVKNEDYYQSFADTDVLPISGATAINLFLGFVLAQMWFELGLLEEYSERLELNNLLVKELARSGLTGILN